MRNAKKIDLTLLNPTATIQDFADLITTAKELNSYSVCVPSSMVKSCAGILEETDIKVCTVIGFPLGNQSIEAKLKETYYALFHGADEIDMVLNLSNIKDGRYEEVTFEINNIKDDINIVSNNIILKVIIETDYLTDKEVRETTKAVIKSKADFIKTSTGFASIKESLNVKLKKVQIMSDTISKECSNLRIKVSGGVKSQTDIDKCLNIKYVDRISTSTIEY